MKIDQSNKKRNNQLGKLWPLHFEIHGMLIIYLEKGKTIIGEYYCVFLDELNDRIKKTITFGEENNFLSSRQCTSTQVNNNDGKIVSIIIRIATSFIIFARFSS